MFNSRLDDESVNEIAGEILRYLERHPGAKDTVEGVLRWWLVEYRYEVALRKTRQALERLVEEGKVRSEPGLSGGLLYSGPES